MGGAPPGLLEPEGGGGIVYSQQEITRCVVWARTAGIPHRGPCPTPRQVLAVLTRAALMCGLDGDLPARPFTGAPELRQSPGAHRAGQHTVGFVLRQERASLCP